MAGPSNIIGFAHAAPTTSVSELWAASAGSDYGVNLRVMNNSDNPILYSWALAPTGTDPVLIPSTSWHEDFEVEARKPYDLEENLQVPEEWSIFHRASDNGLIARVSGVKKEVT